MTVTRIIIRCINMLIKLRLLLPVSLSLLSIACATTGDEINKKKEYEPGELDLIICEEPRPQICTREYDPVCATLQDGSAITGSTGCTSCSDPEVVGYKKGACGIVSLD
ncbi:MAG: hypothetical protein GQ550_05955 [Gammaproteobacteria bacterium]|nr:hypothetical protein [Gammaproteobacteria bacterium]